MSGLNIKVSLEVEHRLRKSQRIINLKLPSYGDDFCGQLLLEKYNVYHYDLTSKKIHLKKSHSKPVTGLIKWIFKCTVFALELIFPVFAISPSQILSLFFEGIESGQALIRNSTKKDFQLLSSLSKHIKIKSKPCSKYKKNKNIIYVFVDEKTTAQSMATINFLTELINHKYICDSSLVILSKIKLLSPPQEILDLYGDEEKNQFVANFKDSFLDYLLNENYIEATRFIKELMGDNADLSVSTFEFIIQCLAFCYKNLNESEFMGLFDDSDLNVNSHLYFGKTISFIENSGRDKNFLRFCFIFLEKYYNERPKIIQEELTATFKQIVIKAKEALTSKDEFLSAIKLFAKYSPSEETVDGYIVASLHAVYVKNLINDECLWAIKEYESFVPRAKLFLRLIALNEETQNKSDIQSILNTVINFEYADPVVKLCFMYHLVNPIYKSNCCTEKFLIYYKTLFNQATINKCNPSLLCLFGAQFLLLYATIEDIEIRKKNAKFSNVVLQLITQNKALLENKKVYLKIIRSINGIFVDNFRENLSRLQSVEKDVEQDVFEKILYQINLGTLYAYNTDYKASVKVYRNINMDVLNNMPLSIRASFFNNYEVFKYLNNPSTDSAQRSLNRIQKFITQNSMSSLASEEFIHLKINFLIFSIIVNAGNDLDDLLENTETIVAGDNYFQVYFEQAKWLYYTIKGEQIGTEHLVESVFFINKKSFFQQKRDALNAYINDNTNKALSRINEFLQIQLSNFDDLDFFKNVTLFSLVERWYE